MHGQLYFNHARPTYTIVTATGSELTVYRGTACISTGVYDSKGIEIYEHDVVEYTEDGKKRLAEVAFYGVHGFKLEPIEGELLSFSMSLQPCECTVIGNTIDNPKLISRMGDSVMTVKVLKQILEDVDDDYTVKLSLDSNGFSSTVYIVNDEEEHEILMHTREKN